MNRIFLRLTYDGVLIILMSIVRSELYKKIVDLGSAQVVVNVTCRNFKMGGVRLNVRPCDDRLCVDISRSLLEGTYMFNTIVCIFMYFTLVHCI